MSEIARMWGERLNANFFAETIPYQAFVPIETAIPLAIRLETISIATEALGNMVELKGKFSANDFPDRIVVEKSENSRDFIQVKTLDLQKPSFKITLESAINSENIHYRIAWLEHNAKKYSKILSLSKQPQGENSVIQLTKTSLLLKKELSHWVLNNMHGQVVSEGVISNTYWDLTLLKPGFYILRGYSQGKLYTFKFSK
jgi:hypothetical protein